ncbi:flap endonuclease GEN homolog 1-like [Pomacea canaliculata]|nr:flap endonuclease GEN homolog 1-like [Pomacea canaliculata]XP_025076808.1 flap endonuclease GEN homolog 1-like [Pomacea canaliculata]
MGVTGLWDLLGGGEELELTDCSGETWAVDLTAWMVHAHAASFKAKGVSGEYVMMITVLHRALGLMKCGIRPVFVMDGQFAPAIKEDTLQHRSLKMKDCTKENPTDRSSMSHANIKCQRLLESLGLPVIASMGEAEKTCAYLNQKGIVDACLSDDSDAFLYGAKTIYRRFNLDQKTAECYRMCDIESSLNLQRSDLVVLGLLSGCDYSKGVEGIGAKKAYNLICSMKENQQAGQEDVLSRIVNWRSNEELEKMVEKQRLLMELKKPAHCSICRHQGDKQHHLSSGCSICGTKLLCLPEPRRDCSCLYHQLVSEVTPYKLELDARRRALKNADFPDKKLMEEFLNEDSELGHDFCVQLSLPDWERLAEALGQHFNMNHEQMMKKMIPVLAHMHLHDTLPYTNTSPKQILKSCIRKRVPCYQIHWQRFDFDKWSPVPSPQVDLQLTPKAADSKADPYIIDVSRTVFSKRYPEMVTLFDSTPVKRKRGRIPFTPSCREQKEESTGAKKKLIFNEGESVN